MMSFTRAAAAFATAALALAATACAPPSDADLAATRGSRVEVYFNAPGTNNDNIWRDPDALWVARDLIDSARATIDFSVMGFSKDEMVEPLLDAYDRGVQVRMAGDSDHLYNSGYQAFIDRGIPMVVGNGPHIMHNKFMVVDDRYTFAGTANWTPTDMVRNSNNFFLIDHPGVAQEFQDEFEQMWDGRFGFNKVQIDDEREFLVDDTLVEVWFSPNEDAMGRILELVDAAEHNVLFTIFAFTKDQVGSAYIRKQTEWIEQDMAEMGLTDEEQWHALPYTERRTISGVIDQSQLHSNNQYHETYRLLSARIPLRLDGNDNSRKPGDYQAGGGRLHSKTMMIDTLERDPEVCPEGSPVQPVVISGSFNWSASATVSNDEFLIVFRGAPLLDAEGNETGCYDTRVADHYNDYYRKLWDDGRHFGRTYVVPEGMEPDDLGVPVQDDRDFIRPGDVTLNEIMWYGVNSADRLREGFDEFIELKNNTDRDLHLDMWQISGVDDFVVGLVPGITIPAGERFLIVDHVLEPYVDGEPQDENTAFTRGDMVVNAFNDNRQHRLYLKDGALELFLADPTGRIVDRAGDGGPAFFGGPDGESGESASVKKYSMERREDAPGDGTSPSDWKRCTADQGTDIIREDMRDEIIATPGAENSR